ncbi:MBL fold metallo-hydrolase [Campylobacter sp. faydin G-105]|uniref:MBL fold metallo-hydrolase n=1 Tax=Campylobacter anatolicus TaxID=2829105 RepID=UPI001B9BA656|nr:MBL fold metallo-hydrolase [Campylobacter anatolicus]MBR8461603.1 MBL fold metallo-hydrolase [Campylobacter anatolicus]
METLTKFKPEQLAKYKGKMQIKTIKFAENGYMKQGFAFGGEDGPDRHDNNVLYRSGLQNYLIDTGDDVILIDTGFPRNFPVPIPDEKTMIYTGKKINDYIDGLAKLGYKPEQITKIIITHKHIDHTGEVNSFPNAKVYASRVECESNELKGCKNLIPVDFTSGTYYNYEKSEIIAPGIRMLPAVGHTMGNSIAVAELDGIFYIFQGDVTYTDETLYANRLSDFYEDINEARKT